MSATALRPGGSPIGRPRAGWASPAVALLVLAALGAALGLALARTALPPGLLLAGGLALLGTLALAVVRYDAAIVLGLLLLGVVRFEPAPVDGVFAVVMAVALATGRFRLRDAPLGMAALVAAFLALNLVSCLEVRELTRALQFLSVTVYLCLFGLWLATYVDRPRRARTVLRVYLAIATLFAVAASLALFVPFPGAGLLTTSDGVRAQGLFKDPNVFGPFLVPAALLLIGELLQPRLLRLRRMTGALAFAALSAGIVFSYSRAAWLNLVLGVGVMLAVLILRRGGSRRALALLLVVTTSVTALVWVIVATGSVGFLEDRARLQSYDSQRFGAQRSGVELAEANPIGIGPGQFELVAPISAHSTYVRALAEEGVLGLAVLLALLVGTLALAGRNAVLARDTWGIGSTALLAAWCGLLANSVFVDTLHWRHLWLLAGLIWAGAMVPSGTRDGGLRRPRAPALRPAG